MKNGKIKPNKTKILARVMAVVFLISSVINLTACISIGKQPRPIYFNSHLELVFLFLNLQIYSIKQ